MEGGPKATNAPNVWGWLDLGRTKPLLYFPPRQLEAWFWAKPQHSRFLHALLWRAFDEEQKDSEIQQRATIKTGRPRRTATKAIQPTAIKTVYMEPARAEIPVSMAETDIFELVAAERLKKNQKKEATE